jgi:SWI/SNF-related matrix-associated actin-dependent regulator 1 of chromatin subfamily A
MNAPLYPFQATAIDRASDGEQIYLGFDPGLGKSRTALEIAKQRYVKRLLVIAPASGRYVWESEVRKWTKTTARIVTGVAQLNLLAGPGIVVISYGLISQKDSPFVAAINRGAPFDMTVLDEAAAVKNSTANRTKAILGKMLPRLGYVLPMSGTPAPNHAGELYPILKALYPDAIKSPVTGTPMLQWQFEDAYCRVVEKRFGGGRAVRTIEGSKNLDQLKRRIDPFMIRVRKEDVLKDLPPIRYDVVPLQVDGAAAALTPSLPVGMSDGDFLKYLSGIGGDEHIMRLRRHLGLAKALPAVEWINDLMESLPAKRKVLVFAHHKDVITLLAGGLQNWGPLVITGATTPDYRTLAVDAFLTEPRCRIFIGNIQAAGTGLTLVGPQCACSDVVFVEASYSVGDNVQAAARVHRIGQNDAVVARFLTAHGTIDDRIQDILARKAKDFSELFN